MFAVSLFHTNSLSKWMFSAFGKTGLSVLNRGVLQQRKTQRPGREQISAFLKANRYQIFVCVRLCVSAAKKNKSGSVLLASFSIFLKFSTSLFS
jgi:hypothetical protein